MEKISVNTSLGVLEACVGADPELHPEIFVYLRREDGAEIDLSVVCVNEDKGEVVSYMYNDPRTDSYTESFRWSEKYINQM